MRSLPFLLAKDVLSPAIELHIAMKRDDMMNSNTVHKTPATPAYLKATIDMTIAARYGKWYALHILENLDFLISEIWTTKVFVKAIYVEIIIEIMRDSLLLTAKSPILKSHAIKEMIKTKRANNCDIFKT